MNWISKLIGRKAAPVEREVVQPGAPGFDLADPRLPEFARAQVERIRETIEGLIARNAANDFYRIAISELVQMRDEHLPKLLRSYVEIPPEFRKEIFRKSGRSASYLLEEALGVMQARIDEISSALARDDIEAFASNTDFISKRYSKAVDPFS